MKTINQYSSSTCHYFHVLTCFFFANDTASNPENMPVWAPHLGSLRAKIQPTMGPTAVMQCRAHTGPIIWGNDGVQQGLACICGLPAVAPLWAVFVGPTHALHVTAAPRNAHVSIPPWGQCMFHISCWNLRYIATIYRII